MADFCYESAFVELERGSYSINKAAIVLHKLLVDITKKAEELEILYLQTHPEVSRLRV